MDLILLLLILSAAYVNGGQLTTLTREEINDMFKDCWPTNANCCQPGKRSLAE